MAEVDDFMGAVLPTLRETEIAFHNGDAGPRSIIWSHADPVTLFGAHLTRRGWTQLGPAFEFLASRFSDCQSYEFEVVAAGASGDLAYVVAYEHSTLSIGGAPPEAYVLRVTLVFRRENGEWRQAHRHADPMPEDDGTRRQLARL
jgi:ketosteroid isomerase-like protein